MHKIRKILWISATICFFISLILKGFLFYSNQSFEPEEINRWFEPITSKYGVQIVYNIREDFFSPLENPPIPAGPSKDSEVQPIRHRVLSRYPDILQTSFKCYPDRLIRTHLKIIFFAGEINQHGFRAGGTYDPFRKALYLVNDGAIDDERAVYVVHHEFSSLLLNSRSFFVNPWTENNPEGFEYLYDKSDDTLRTFNQTSSIGTGADYKMGFMDTYGQTNFENDFNEYSAMIFTYPDKFKKIMDQYPRVRAKFKVWLEFYQQIDPIFTEDYFFGAK